MRGLEVADKDNLEKEVNIFFGGYSNHDFGYPCSLPKNLTIDGFEAPNAKKVNIFNISNLTPEAFKATEDNKNLVTPPENIRISDITGDIELSIFAQSGLENTAKVDIVK